MGVVVEVHVRRIAEVRLDDEQPPSRLEQAVNVANHRGRRVRVELLEDVRRERHIEGSLAKGAISMNEQIKAATGIDLAAMAKRLEGSGKP